MTHTVTSKDNTSISYTTSGDGPNTVLMLHGWMVSGAVYDGLQHALSNNDQLRLVTLDFRGTGNSGASSDYSLDHYVQDVEAVVEALGAPVHLIGHSMGGQIAQLFAARHPEHVSSMTLISPVPVQGVPLPPELVGLFSSSGQDRDKQGQILSMACLDLNEADRNKLLDNAGTIDPNVIAQSFASWTGGGDTEELANITAPTLVIGSDDPFLPPEFLTAAVVNPIANATHTHINGAGHYIQVERLDECAQAIQTFLNDNA